MWRWTREDVAFVYVFFLGILACVLLSMVFGWPLC